MPPETRLPATSVTFAPKDRVRLRPVFAGAIVWDATAKQFGLEYVETPAFIIEADRRRRRELLDRPNLDDLVQAGGDVRGGEGRREEERARPLPQPLHESRGAGHIPAHDAEGFRHRADLDIDPAVESEVVDDAAAAAAEDALAVGVVDHDESLVRLGHRHDGIKGGDVPVHRENPVGDHQDALRPGGPRRGDGAVQIGGVGVAVDGAGGAGEAHAVHD